MDILHHPERGSIRPSPRLTSLLPPNLKIVQISEGTKLTRSVIKDIFKAKKQGELLQSLTRVEIFFQEPQILTGLNPEYLKDLCSNAALALSFYFPRFPITAREVNRSLWSLKPQRLIAQTGWEKFCKGNDITIEEANEIAPYYWGGLRFMKSFDCESYFEKGVVFDAEGNMTYG